MNEPIASFQVSTNIGITDVAKLVSAAFVLAVVSSLLQRCRRSAKIQRRRRSKSEASSAKDKSSVVPVDSVLYLPSKPAHDCDDEYDVIVIGSGIGGLTTASLLAQRGDKVLVLEQHSVCGGCCHSFRSGGYRFGTGIHYVGQVGHDFPTWPKSVLDAITYPNDPIRWDRMAENFDTLYLGKQSDSTVRRYQFVSAGWKGQKRILKEQFSPQDHDAIDKYYDIVHEAARSWKRMLLLKMLPLAVTKFINRVGLGKWFAKDYDKFASASITDVVTSLTDNTELQAALAYNWGDHGCEPSEAPFAIQAGLASHYVHGSFYPHGGTQNVARKIIPTITDCGGKVLAHAPVKEIIVNKWTGRALGVELKGGRRIRARKAVVSDATLLETLEHLLPASLKCRDDIIGNIFGSHSKEEVEEEKGKLKKGVTGIYLAVGLKGDHDADFQLPHTQHWVYPTAEAVLSDTINAQSLEEELRLRPEDLFLFMTCPSGKDLGWKADFPGKSTVELMTFVPSGWFEAPRMDPEAGGLADPGGRPNEHGAKYDVAKTKIAELMWTRGREVLENGGAKNLPPTIGGVDHYQVGSPLTFAHYFRRDGGPWYGTKNDKVRHCLKMATEVMRSDSLTSKIPGLYITGQDSFMPGFAGSMMGGWMCASKISGTVNPFSMLELDRTHWTNPFRLATNK